MKIFTTLAVICMGFSTLLAQSTITRSDLFVAGDMLSAVEALEIPDVSPAGANVTWDFSDLQIDTPNIVTVHIADSDTTPYAADYPTSDIVQTLGFGGLTFYQYMESNADGISIVGEVIPGFVPGQSVYSDPELIVATPLTYQSTWTDDFAYNLEFQGTADYMGEGNTEAVVDAYGTLRLPGATFDDALRVQTILFETDTADLGFDLYERNFTYDTTWFWLSPSYPGPLCSYSRTRTRSVVYLVTADTTIVDEETFTDESFSFDPMIGTSSVKNAQPGLYTLSVSPNPFESSIQLTFSTDRSQEMQFILRDLHGREVYAENLGILTGDVNMQISVPSLPGGMYIALLQSETGADVQKLIRLNK